MAEPNTDIILAAGNINDPTRMLSLAEMGMKVQQERRQIAGQNALRMLFSDPSSLDPQGNLTPQAQAKVMSIDPMTGMKLRDQALNDQVRRAQLQHEQTATGALKWQAMGSIAGAGVTAYNEAKNNGKSEQEALAAGASARNEAAKNNGGFLDENSVMAIISQPFDIAKATALARTNKEYATAEHQERADTRAQQAETERERHDRSTEDRMFAALAQKNAPSDLTDEDKDYWADVLRKGGSLPPGLSRTAAGSKLVQELMKRVPEGSTPGEKPDAGMLLSKQAEQHADRSSLTNITKIADSAEAYENTAIKNFDQAMKLADKGVPTDMGPWINRWVQDGETALGNPDVPPYVAALLTGANEYAKVMSGSTGSQGSTVDSRKEAAQLFSRALDKDQITNVINVAKKDMENKKASYRAQRNEISGRISGSATKAPADHSGLTDEELKKKLGLP